MTDSTHAASPLDSSLTIVNAFIHALEQRDVDIALWRDYFDLAHAREQLN